MAGCGIWNDSCVVNKKKKVVLSYNAYAPWLCLALFPFPVCSIDTINPEYYGQLETVETEIGNGKWKWSKLILIYSRGVRHLVKIKGSGVRDLKSWKIWI